MSAKKKSGCAFGISLDRGKDGTTESSHYYLIKPLKYSSFRVKVRSASYDISKVFEFREQLGAICLPIIWVK